MKVSIGGGLRVADLQIDGTEAEVAKTLALLGFEQEGLKNGTTGRATGGTVTQLRPTPAVADKEPAKPARTETKPEKAAEAAPKPRGRPRKVEAVEPEEEEDAAEDEDEDEAPPPKAKAGKKAKEGKAIEIDPDAPELTGAKRLRDVVRYLMSQGITEEAEVISTCEQLKPDVDILRRVTDVAERVHVAFEMIVKEDNRAED